MGFPGLNCIFNVFLHQGNLGILQKWILNCNSRKCFDLSEELFGSWFKKSQGMGCSCRNLVFQLTRDFFRGLLIRWVFSGWQLPSDFAGRVCIPYTHSSRCWPLREINSKVQNMGIRATMMGPMGENLERNEFGSRRGLFGHVKKIYIYIYTYIFF